MALVGSLMFFLLRVFYQGQFQERLHFVMACFVFAAVLIGRISIEQGFERAAPFGAVLAILVGIAANRFMEYQGTWVDPYSWIINFTVIGIVWWCAHQLTWDCTVVDDAEDSSGEGLMQVVGLERPADERNAVADQERLAGTTTRQVPASFWQRYVEHQRRPHAPGVWVVYFSLAALPIFGLGQWLIPASDTGGRRYVFLLLCVYVASGLGLLLTTSFLGLRRYLRQRRIEMPTMMANLWLATGTAIVAVLIVTAALLPRPSAEYAISKLPFNVGSPDQQASRFAPSKKNGTHDDQQGPAAEKENELQAGDHPPEGTGHQPGGQSAGKASGDSPGDSPGEGSGQGEQPGKRQSSDQSSGQSSEKQGQGDKQQSRPSQSKPSSGPSGKSAQGADSQAAQNEQQSPSEQNSQPEETDTPRESEFVRNMKKYREAQKELAAPYENKPKGEQSQQAEPSADAESQASEPMDIPSFEAPLSPLMTIAKYIFYGLFILAVLLALWRYWHEVLRAIRNFLTELRNWWRTLWGGKRDYGVAEDAVLDIRVPPPPFASFADPFASGAASGLAPEELVRYSFEAFEAWSREHGCQRDADQTPHELARDVGRLNREIATDARNLAELYSRAAYARGRLPQSTSDQLRQLWRQMSRRQQAAPSTTEITDVVA